MATYKIIGGDRKVYGPVNEEELRRWVAEGRLNAQSLIQPEDATDWQPLSAFPEFAADLQAQTGISLSGTLPAAPINPEVFAAEVLSRQPSLQIGSCLTQSWQLLMANFGVFFGATFIVWIIGAVCERIPFVGLAYALIRGALMGGLYLVFLRRVRSQPASVGDVFEGFRQNFLQLMLAGLVSWLLAGIGFCFCIVPWIYLSIAWVFSIPLVADKALEFWSAMELSRKVVTRVWFQVFGLFLLAFLPVILVSLFASARMGASMVDALQAVIGSNPPDPQRITEIMTQAVKASLPYWVLTKVVLLLNLPFGLGALMYAYEALFGARPASAP